MKAKCQEYEWEFDEDKARLTCKRHGQEWRDETGDGAVLALLQECDRLQAEILRLKAEKPKLPSLDEVNEYFGNDFIPDRPIYNKKRCTEISGVYQAIKRLGNFQ